MEKSYSRFTEVYWPLSIAKEASQSLQELQDSGAAYGDDAERRSAITIVFAAAAVEAALNTFVSRPILQIDDPATREFFGQLLHRHFRGSVPAKLKFLRQRWPQAKDHRKLIERIGDLFTARNALMHIYPDYVVALGPHPDSDMPLNDEDWIEYPDLQWTKQHVVAPGQAGKFLECAIEFIDVLPEKLNYDPLRPANDS